MNKYKIEEILNMKMLIGHLDLTTDTKNKLYNQTTKIEDILNKQKEVLDKIDKLINTDNGWTIYYEKVGKDYIRSRIRTEINELLEEIE